MIHALDCGGGDAPWCSPACVAATPVADPAAALLTFAEAAAYLGLTVRTVSRWADRGLVTVWEGRLLLAADVLEAERRTRRQPKGRPRSRRVA